MIELSVEDRKKLLLEMLLEIDSFCRVNGIQYFLTGGTLLGAIRHKGFIPWDDDIDIAMIREDYERFAETFNEKYIGHLKWIDLSNTENYYLPFGKIIDTRTSLFENIAYAIEIGIYIDIFPIDNLGDDEEIAAEKINPIKALHVSKERSIIKNIAILLCKLYPCDGNKLAKKRDSKYKRIAKGNNGKYVANLYGAWGTKEITLKSNFDSALETDFEGHQFMIPVGYDNLLKDVYGDYMKLPPEEKRVSHHENKAYWKDKD